MKLILKEYLASLKERDELDAILPDLLSEMGFTVFSRPGRGTRQDGVDVGAVGQLDTDTEKVFLFAIKPGDVTRKAWDGDSIQSLRPTLNEIIDAYIPNRLPAEHAGKDIVICLCCGGDILEQVRAQIEGFKSQKNSPNIKIDEWNGDKLADLIQSHFLREDLLPVSGRNLLRKALALLDEPEVSYAHFASLIRLLSDTNEISEKEIVRRIRQISLCIWILFAWSRDGDNIEASFKASELALLHGWEIAKPYAKKKSKTAIAAKSAFQAILTTHQQISMHYLKKCILPHVHIKHGISNAVHGPNSIDVNLKLFDILGRIGLAGLWTLWMLNQSTDEDIDSREAILTMANGLCTAIQHLVLNNPTLLLPYKDDQAIDVMIAALFLAATDGHKSFIEDWLTEMLGRCVFSYQAHGPYPCNINKYSELLERRSDNEYRKENTAGSILYPTIALWGAVLDIPELYFGVAKFKADLLPHCNFQLWYPDTETEKHLYLNTNGHGATLSHVPVDRPPKEFLRKVLKECESSSFSTLSATEESLWPLIILACRHYRLPIPLSIVQQLCHIENIEGDTESGQD